MGAIISLLVIVAISLVVVRIGTLALVMTGLSREIASFQAYSAFFGVGFTTRESEMVVGHVTRRRIIKHLILTGNVGLAAGAGSIIVAFVKADGALDELSVLAWICAGAAGLWLLSIMPPVRAVLDWLIKASLRRAGVAQPRDFELLLRVHAGFVVEDVSIHAGSRWVGQELSQAQLGSQGVVVLGCTRRDADGHEEYIGTPTGDFRIEANDRLTVYGRQGRIAELLGS
jgi:TrkA-C domain